MEIGIKTTVNVNIKTLKLNIKVTDSFMCDIVDDKCNKVGSYEGYVPGFFPGQHYGDYLELEINVDTGQIVNWQKPTAEQIEQLLNRNDEDEMVTIQ